MKRKNKIQIKTKTEKIFDVIIIIAVILLTIIFLYPFLYILAVSFNDPSDTLKGGIVLWPRKFSTIAYETVFQNDSLLNAYGITIARTVIGAVTSVAFTGMFAYGLSKKRLISNTMMKTDCRKLFTRTHIHPHSSHYQTVQPTKRSSAKTEMSLRSHHS